MIRAESIRSLKAIIQIVDVVSHYMELHKIGSSYKGLCPFHTEKTPSFVVDSNKGLFYCFGCQKGGDAIKFVMEYEHLSYAEAIEKIAMFYNFRLEYSKTRTQKTDILEKLAEFFATNFCKTNRFCIISTHAISVNPHARVLRWALRPKVPRLCSFCKAAIMQ